MRPTWFYGLLAACVVALTVAIVLRLRWQPYGGPSLGNVAMIDTWRGRACVVVSGPSTGQTRACFPIGVDLASRLDHLRELTAHPAPPESR